MRGLSAAHSGLLTLFNHVPMFRFSLKQQRPDSSLSHSFSGSPSAAGLDAKLRQSFQRMHTGVFFSAFLKNWKQVGSPVQTSRHGAKKICDSIDFTTARRIVEVGSGAGSITKEILKCLRPDAQLIVFEINRDLCQCLSVINDDRLVVYNISGFDIANVLREKADYVISAIPIATLSNASLSSYFRGIKSVLHERGACIQLQLSLFSYRRVKRFFKTVKVAFTLLNPPPLFIYSCRDR
jgi:phospholipid N-methyltransferase